MLKLTNGLLLLLGIVLLDSSYRFPALSLESISSIIIGSALIILSQFKG